MQPALLEDMAALIVAAETMKVKQPGTHHLACKDAACALLEGTAH
jgi:hypothetical protein